MPSLAYKIYFWLAFGLIFLYAQPLWGQKKVPEDEKVTLERAEELVKDQQNPNVRKLIRRVVIKHKGSILYCDSAYLHEDKNAVDAFGHARLLGEDGTRLTSDSMYYDGTTQIARAIGDVVLIDDEMRLTTQELDYHVQEGVAYYYSGGKIVDSEKTLESQTGSYDTNSKIFYFKQDVELITKKDGRKITTDDLKYNTVSKLAYFQGPTWIESDDGKVYTESGTFNTETEVSNFKGRTRLDNAEYSLEGDTLYFDNIQRKGYAEGNVRLFSKKDSVIIDGDIGWFIREKGESKVYGNALMRNISKGDTLYLAADTLYSLSRPEDSIKILTAYPATRVYKTEFQAICDSLVYNRIDSTIYLYRDPVLWNQGSQLTADSIQIQISENRIEQMDLRRNAFMISEDTLENYNQLKGKNMQAYFSKNQIQKVEVRGNGQNIYFVLKQDTLLVGMNRVECSDIDIRFKDRNKLHQISYLNKPDGVMVPPHEIQGPETRLKNFAWRIEERPRKEEMIRPEVLVLMK